MPTVAEILKASGLDDTAIAALDAKVVEGFTKVISTAEQAHEQAALEKRAQVQLYDQQIAPALDKWANDKAAQDTKLAAYEAALKAAKEGGFQIPDILAPAAPRTPSGQFVAGGNDVPGSPKFVESIKTEIAGAFGAMADLTWKYESLYGTKMPDSPTALIREAQQQHMDPVSYAAKKYDFAGKESARRAEDQKKHDDAIRAEVKAATDKEWAEKVGNNPNIRRAEPSAFSTVNKAVSSGERPDPLKMTREQRHVATRQAINKEIAEHETVQ